MWKTLGEKETGAPAVETAIVIEKPLNLKLGLITGDRLAPGRYKVQLQVLDREPAVFDCLGQKAELNGSGRSREHRARGGDTGRRTRVGNPSGAR